MTPKEWGKWWGLTIAHGCTEGEGVAGDEFAQAAIGNHLRHRLVGLWCKSPSDTQRLIWLVYGLSTS
jgi:hypothetical protein